MNTPPSILFVLPWHLSKAVGVNQVVINLARETARRGKLRPIIFCADSRCETFEETETPEGIKLVTGHLRAPLTSSQTGRNLAVFAHKLRDDMAVWRAFIDKHRVRVINAHYPGLNYAVFALLRRRLTNFRLLFSLHGADIAGIERSGMAAKPFARWMLKKADRIVCCSEDLEKRTQESLKLDENCLCTIHNGIDIAELDLAKKDAYRPNIGSFDNYLVNVAAFEHGKGQDLLLQAYTQLLRDGLKSALVLIGHKTPHLESLRNGARQLGLQDHVFFISDLDHMKTLSAIRNARLLVQASREEAFGLPLLEAGYLGTPVVATRVGGTSEVLGSYYPYLADANDPAALAAKIDEALYNPTETKQQIKLVKRRVATNFTWGRAYSAYTSAWSAGLD